MSLSQFVHLHNHTGYSLLDGSARISDLVDRAAELGMDSLAITDHGTLFGLVEFYKACRSRDIRPILGCEVYVARDSRFDRRPRVDEERHHLILLAKNETGYRNLLKLVSAGCTEGFYYKPRIDFELLTRHHEGLVATSACIAGQIPGQILKGDLEGARATATAYRDLFGGDFYLELQDHGLREEKEANQHLIRLGRELGIGLVCANDVHYVEKKDAVSHDALLCIQTGRVLSDEDRMRFPAPEFYLKSPDEMGALFSHVPEALANTVEIARKCDVNLETGKMYLPRYQVPEGHNLNSYLRHLCYEGLTRRKGTLTEEMKSRLDFELSVIEKMDYPGYFLIVWDMIRFARQEGIYVGPGRGSAAGSLVAYALSITDIDPLEYNLLFERFLNPERVTMPDIDTDFCFERRGEVIEYLTRTYGSDHVAQIVTFGTLSARSAIRDVGRVMEVPLPEVDRIAKMVPGELNITLERALSTSPELRARYEESETVRQLIDTARAIEGLPRHTSTHAAGVVIAPGSIEEYLPVMLGQDDAITTQYTMGAVEEIGLLKMDLLGLRTLTVIGKALDHIEKNTGVRVDLDTVSLTDPETYGLLSRGDTAGVFQLESAGMQGILRNLRPENLEDVIALVALYRPGPLGSGMVEDFIASKHGQKKARYLHPALEPILRDTYGVILYQEQVMRISSDLAGFTLGEADLLRRAMGKKKKEIIEEQKAAFIRGATGRGVEKKTAEAIYELMAHFAGYGFNKSHSAAYGLIAFRTAWLKAHYPAEFMAAMLTSVMGFTDKVTQYIEECRKMGLKVLPPDINESLDDFTPLKGAIRFGLGAVRNVGHGAIRAIVEAREAGGRFRDLDDFCERVDLHQVNRRVVESLIYGGALDCLGHRRSQMLAVLDLAMEKGVRRQEERDTGQVSLFDVGELTVDTHTEMPDLKEFPPAEILEMEKTYLGFYVSGHPLDSYRVQLSARGLTPLAALREKPDGQVVAVGGLVSRLKKSVTRKNEMMAYLGLEDLSGEVEVLVFPRLYREVADRLEKDQVVLIRGRLNTGEEEPKIFAEKVLFDLEILNGRPGQGIPGEKPAREEKPQPAAEPEAVREGTLCIRVSPETAECLRTTRDLLAQADPGGCRLRFELEGGPVVDLEEEYGFTCPPHLERDLRELWGDQALRWEDTH